MHGGQFGPPGTRPGFRLLHRRGIEMARRMMARTLLAFAGALLLSTAAYAQSAIVGIVKDTTGATMPGVTVEASSDVLIEKVKSAVSDENGNYRIADLRPGTY